MRLLLDTHALLWMIADDPRLSPVARQAIVSATDIFWSMASVWEIGIKLSLDRPDFRLGPGWARLIPEEMQRNGIRRLGIEPAHAEAVARLPWHHRDPFDRLLIAQAQTENLTLLSRNGHIPQYSIPFAW